MYITFSLEIKHGNKTDKGKNSDCTFTDWKFKNCEHEHSMWLAIKPKSRFCMENCNIYIYIYISDFFT